MYERMASQYITQGGITTAVDGSMTVEAAIILPLFIFFFLNLVSCFQILKIHSDMEQALHQTGQELTVQAYAYREIDGAPEHQLKSVLQAGFTELYVKNEVIKYLGKEKIENSLIVKGISGLDFSRSQILINQDDLILIQVNYAVKPMIPMLGFGKICLSNRFYGKAWTGYSMNQMDLNIGGVPYVYITEYGKSYHTQRNCTHLTLSIEQITLEDLDMQKNSNGENYSCCEICGSVQISQTIFITEEGNRYHNNILCSGLKRSVYAIPLSEVENRQKCSRCGGEV
ncbi:MAG: pilus assembly protein [Lachnospiraceae bacterium]|nr:pilus assembly protein [Lachnospiraceae bacterium]